MAKPKRVCRKKKYILEQDQVMKTMIFAVPPLPKSLLANIDEVSSCYLHSEMKNNEREMEAAIMTMIAGRWRGIKPVSTPTKLCRLLLYPCSVVHVKSANPSLSACRGK
jgi:hypothetical protein